MFVALLTPLGGMRADTAAPAQPGSSMQEVIAMAANEVLAAQHKDHYIYLSKERSERTGGHLWTEKVVETDAGKVRFLLAEDGAPLAEFPAAGWDKVLDLNLKTPFFLTRAFLPLLEAAGTADDPARVINVGSIDGLRVPEFSTYSYSASKAGLHQLTRVLARELGPRHITVNAVAPGPFESAGVAVVPGDRIASASPLGRAGRADDMAGVAVFLSGRGGAYITGAVIPVDGGTWAAR